MSGIPMYDNPDLYEMQNADGRKDVACILELARRYAVGPVLELACGTGILSIPLARAGHEVVGIDLSLPMIAYAKRKSAELPNIEFLVGDMTKFALNRKFGFVFLGFNSICHLTTWESMRDMLASVYAHLTEAGVFVTDCFIPDPRYFMREKDKHFPVFNEKGLHIDETNDYDPLTQINHIKWYYEYQNEKWTEDLDMREYYPQELQNYLKLSGFDIVAHYGDHDLNALSSASPLQIYVSRKRDVV